MSQPKIYLIPGLGADGRMYTHQLKVLQNAVVLEHQKPLPGETITAYAQRLTAKVNTKEPFILVGTSLGGIIAIEMAQFIKPKKIILISSVKHRNELPGWIRSMKHLKLHHLITGETLIKLGNSNIKRIITRRDASVAQLLVDMHNNADPKFLEWAINEVVNWQGQPNNKHEIVHIHGTMDRLFPHRHINNAVYVKGGTHIMGLTQAADVNKALLKAINS